MNQEKINEVFDICLKEMFLRVGLDGTKIDEFTKKEKWYSSCTWSKEDQDDFEKWMIKTLIKKMKWTKKQSIKEISFFILNYGWKVV
jgi:hypothetical protein